MQAAYHTGKVAASGRLLIVDGHAYAYRAFYAIRSLNSPAGQPTNAIYGFIKMLARMRTLLAPSHGVVIWDGGLAAERKELLPEYKAQRPPMPDDLDAQIRQIQEYLAAEGITSLERDGVEADDWIAAVARRAAGAGFEVVIASSDKDFMQLVSDRIGLLNPNDKTESVWTAAQVQARTGLPPEAIVDWLALIGDSVDNIAGVPGVGPKTATDLLARFGSVEELYPRLAEVKSERLRAALQACEAVVRRNQRLIRLHDQVAGPGDSAELEFRPADVPVLRQLYGRWGFRTMLQELESKNPMQAQLL